MFFIFDVYCRRAGHDVNYMALAGLLEISGAKGSTPPLVGFQGADIVGSLQVFANLCLFLCSLLSSDGIVSLYIFDSAFRLWLESRLR
jgi:hypothetical protein